MVEVLQLSQLRLLKLEVDMGVGEKGEDQRVKTGMLFSER